MDNIKIVSKKLKKVSLLAGRNRDIGIAFPVPLMLTLELKTFVEFSGLALNRQLADSG